MKPQQPNRLLSRHLEARICVVQYQDVGKNLKTAAREHGERLHAVLDTLWLCEVSSPLEVRGNWEVQEGAIWPSDFRLSFV